MNVCFKCKGSGIIAKVVPVYGECRYKIIEIKCTECTKKDNKS